MTPTYALPREDLEHVLIHTRELWEDLRESSIFITGGTGFVGSWLVETLLHASGRLSLPIDLTLLTRDVRRFSERLPHLALCSGVHLVEGDARCFPQPHRKFEFIVHAATEPPLPPSPAVPLGSFGRDIEATRNVLEFAATHSVSRLLFTSSGAVYGTQPPTLERIPESHPHAPPTTDRAALYGLAKRTSESMCALFGAAYGFEPVVARLFAFVGPRLPTDAHYAVGNFVGDALKGGPIAIEGDGTPSRSYLYSADLAIWLWTMLLRGTGSRPYNVGASDSISILELARMVAKTLDPSIEVTRAKEPVDGQAPARYVPCIKRATQELGLEAHIPLKEGIRRMAQWLQGSRRE